jgi:hypothetical protein
MHVALGQLPAQHLLAPQKPDLMVCLRMFCSLN